MCKYRTSDLEICNCLGKLHYYCCCCCCYDFDFACLNLLFSDETFFHGKFGLKVNRAVCPMKSQLPGFLECLRTVLSCVHNQVSTRPWQGEMLL